MSVRT